MRARENDLGYGVGLRAPHYAEVLAGGAASVDWFEAITENYMDSGGRPLAVLEGVRRNYPVALHGVGLSIGSTDRFDDGYLERLAALVNRIEPVLVSDHLCWTGVGGRNVHDLLPLPYTMEAVVHVAERVDRVQTRLGRRILLENVSSYVGFSHSEMSEWQFVVEVAERADCELLLDVNNIFVNSVNHGFDPYDYVRAVPSERIRQIHLAGHSDRGTFLFDTHDAPVCGSVWELYAETIALAGCEVSTLIEWDAEIPPLLELCAEAERASSLARATLRHAGMPALLARANR